jgi:nucleoside-diphosphate-sugar epimerase
MLTTGEERRQFVHLDDVCSALLLAQQQKLQGLYDVTSFEWITVMDVANLIASCTGAKVFPGKVSGSTPATPLQGKIPGWAPRIDIERGIAQLVEEVRGAAKDSRVSPQRFC